MAFNGTWKVDRNDNYEKFMEEMGINMVKRKLASHDNLKITVEQTGDKFHLKEVSTFRTVEINFTLGVNFEYSMADGTELTVSTRGVFSLKHSEGTKAVTGVIPFQNVHLCALFSLKGCVCVL
uniref:Fatty acid-binding protein, intestinal-like n=1 Tax=Sinocyclocheilus grahami TaxID=75366 RepID=A0A672K2T1_SINGR